MGTEEAADQISRAVSGATFILQEAVQSPRSTVEVSPGLTLVISPRQGRRAERAFTAVKRADAVERPVKREN